MINRENYLAIRGFLQFREEVLQLDPESVKVSFRWLKHLLKWADETPFPDAPTIRPVFPQYLLTVENQHKNKDRLSKATIKKACEYANAFFRWARENEPTRYGAISMSWIATIHPPRMYDEAPKEHEFVSLDMMRKLVAVPAVNRYTRRDQAAAAFLFLSGMRATAFCSLTLECVNIARREVKQWPALGVKTKNRKAARTYLHEIPDLLEVVERWDAELRLTNPPTALWYPPFGDNQIEGFVPTRAAALRDNLKTLSRIAGVPYLSPHKYRHGHAVYGLKNAKDMAAYKAVSQNLMHSNISITDEIYAVLDQDDVKEQIAALGKGEMVDEIVAMVMRKMAETNVETRG